jgi:hypothetical protein
VQVNNYSSQALTIRVDLEYNKDRIREESLLISKDHSAKPIKLVKGSIYNLTLLNILRKDSSFFSWQTAFSVRVKRDLYLLILRDIDYSASIAENVRELIIKSCNRLNLL